MSSSASSYAYRGLASAICAENRRFTNPCFFRKATHFEPLNCESAVQKLTDFSESHLGIPCKDIILQRSCHSRILLFTKQDWEKLQQEKLDKKKRSFSKNNINSSSSDQEEESQEKKNYTYSHYQFQNSQSNRFFKQNADMFLFSGAPIASYVPPPILPFPVEKIALWDGMVPKYENSNEEEDSQYLTLDQYCDLIRETEEKISTTTSSSDENQEQDPKHYVGLFSITRHQLTFVIADMCKNVIQGPWISMNPSASSSNSFHASLEDQLKDQNSLAQFQNEFWKKLSHDLLNSSSSSSSSNPTTDKSFLSQCGALWVKSERDVAVPFLTNCCCSSSSFCTTNNASTTKKELNSSGNKEFLLRDDPRWVRLPTTVKSKKGSFDVDSLLRDCYIGQLQCYV